MYSQIKFFWVQDDNYYCYLEQHPENGTYAYTILKDDKEFIGAATGIKTSAEAKYEINERIKIDKKNLHS